VGAGGGGGGGGASRGRTASRARLCIRPPCRKFGRRKWLACRLGCGWGGGEAFLEEAEHAGMVGVPGRGTEGGGSLPPFTGLAYNRGLVAL
jgi:hypothetical protein